MSDCSVDESLLEFACNHSVVVGFFGDAYGKNVRVSFFEGETEYGHINTIGMARLTDGQPHTFESAVSDALTMLRDDQKKRIALTDKPISGL